MTEEGLMTTLVSGNVSSTERWELIQQMINETQHNLTQIEPTTPETSKNYIMVRYLEIIYQSFFVVLGTPVNLLCLYRKLKECRRPAKSLTNRRLQIVGLNIIMADLIILIPYSIGKTVWLMTYFWYGGYILCKLWTYCATFGYYLWSYLAAFSAVDMFFCLAYPLKSRIHGTKRTRINLGMCWFMACIFSCPQLYVWEQIKVPKEYQMGREGPVYQCMFRFDLARWIPPAYQIFHTVTIFYIPFGIIVAIHIAIGAVLSFVPFMPFFFTYRSKTKRTFFQSGGANEAGDGAAAIRRGGNEQIRCHRGSALSVSKRVSNVSQIHHDHQNNNNNTENVNNIDQTSHSAANHQNDSHDPKMTNGPFKRNNFQQQQSVIMIGNESPQLLHSKEFEGNMNQSPPKTSTTPPFPQTIHLLRTYSCESVDGGSNPTMTTIPFDDESCFDQTSTIGTTAQTFSAEALTVPVSYNNEYSKNRPSESNHQKLRKTNSTLVVARNNFEHLKQSRGRFLSDSKMEEVADMTNASEMPLLSAPLSSSCYGMQLSAGSRGGNCINERRRKQQQAWRQRSQTLSISSNCGGFRESLAATNASGTDNATSKEGRHHSAAILLHRISQTLSIQSNVTHLGRPSSKSTSDGKRQKRKLMYTSLGIILTYLFCWLPYQIIALMRIICGLAVEDPRTCINNLETLEWLEGVMILGACLNPFIYTFVASSSSSSSSSVNKFSKPSRSSNKSSWKSG